MAAAPIMPMMIGAGIGAATSDNPLKGALLGGALGGVGGGMMGIGQAAPAGELAAGESMLGFNGLGASEIAPLGFQSTAPSTLELFPAAGIDSMVTAPTGELGLIGGSVAPSLSPGFAGLGQQSTITLADKMPFMKNLPFSGKGDELMKAGGALNSLAGGNQPPVVQSPMIAPPQMNPNAGGSFTSPYDPSRIGANPYSSMFSQPTILPGFRR